MAHMMEVRNNEAKMFSVGEVPWHKLGKVLDRPLTAKEAIIEAGLNWEVRLEHITTVMGKSIPDKKAVVRMDTNEVLGVVGNIYRPIQNLEAFSFFDSIVGEGQAIYHTAGSLQNGRKIWILAKLTDPPIKVTKSDIVEKYLLLSNSHDGSSTLRMFFTPIRVVCMNTLNTALERSRGTGVYIRHCVNIKTKIKKAKEILGISRVYYNELEHKISMLVNKSIDDSMIDEYVDRVFGFDKEDREKKSLSSSYQSYPKGNRRVLIINKLKELLYSDTNKLPGIQNTLWAMFNALVEYLDYRKTYKTRDSRLESIWFGHSARLKSIAFKEALNFVELNISY